MAMLDFFFGALTTIDKGVYSIIVIELRDGGLENGIEEVTSKQLATNWDSHYDPMNCSLESGEFETKPENFFSVFAMLFANFIGVLAGTTCLGSKARQLQIL